jgi:hypothetical protein
MKKQMASMGPRPSLVRAHYYFSESPAFTREHTSNNPPYSRNKIPHLQIEP